MLIAGRSILFMDQDKPEGEEDFLDNLKSAN